MLQFKSAGSLPPAAGVYPQQAFEIIEKFRRWIGHDRIQEARSIYYANLVPRSSISTALLRETQPLIEAFETYESVTFGRRRVPKKLPDELADLAAVAAQYVVIGPTLAGDVERHHRHAICGPGFRSVLLEWKAASTLVRTNGASNAWFSPSQAAPEFVAKVADLEFEVECKYVSHMITELLGDDKASVFAETIVDALRMRNLCGEVTIELFPTETDRGENDQQAAIRHHLDHAQAGDFTVEIPDLLKLNASLVTSGTIIVSAEDWQAHMAKTKAPDSRAYGNALASGRLDHA